jgi:LysM repeat protein
MKGENLTRIAARYGVTVDQLCVYNGLTKRSILKPGQKLKIYRQETGAE